MGVHYKDQTELPTASQGASDSHTLMTIHDYTDLYDSLDKDHLYSITIKNVTREGQFTTPEQLIEVYRTLSTKRRQVVTGPCVFELDSKNRLHLHGTLSCANFFPPKRKGWHFHTDHLDTPYYRQNWLEYIHKDSHNHDSQMQIVSLNYLYNHNCFS